MLSLSSRAWLRRVTVLFVAMAVGAWSIGTWYYAARIAGERTGVVEDYVVFYAAGRLVAEGRTSDLYHPAAIRPVEERIVGESLERMGGMAYLYPPFLALAYVPLSLLPFEAAAVIVAGGTAALIALGTLALARCLEVKGLAAVALAAGFLSFRPVPQLWVQGQLTMIPFLGLLAYATLARAGRERESGLALALLLVKPQMALVPVLLFAWKRRWRTLVPFGAVAAALLAASMLAGGPDVPLAFAASLRESAGWDGSGGVYRERMYSWSGFLSNFVAYASPIHTLATAALCMVTLGLTALAWRGTWEPSKPRFLHGLSALILCVVLTSPHLNIHDLTLVALAMAFSAKASQMSGDGFGAWPAAALLVWADAFLGARLVDFGVNVVTPALAVVFLANVWSCTRQGRTVPHTTGAAIPRVA